VSLSELAKYSMTRSTRGLSATAELLVMICWWDDYGRFSTSLYNIRPWLRQQVIWVIDRNKAETWRLWCRTQFTTLNSRPDERSHVT